MKVGADLDDDIRRAALLRGELGPDRLLMTDANQRWDVGQAIESIRARRSGPVLDRGADEPRRRARARRDRTRSRTHQGRHR